MILSRLLSLVYPRKRPLAPTVRPGGIVEVVGESRYQGALAKVAGGKTRKGPAKRHLLATLVRETRNPVDPNAVRVEVDGLTVGYLPRKRAKSFHRLLNDAATARVPVIARAEITGGWRNGSDEGSFGIELDIHRSKTLLGAP